MKSPRDPVPVSGAALVPIAGAAIHATSLWLAPTHPRIGSRLLPWPLEIGLVWLPLVMLCLWFVQSAPPGRASQRRGARLAQDRPRSQRLVDLIVTSGALVGAATYFITLRWPGAREAWSPLKSTSELYAAWSTTLHGVPAFALGSVLAWGATCAVFERALTALWAGNERFEHKSKTLGVCFALVIFAVGSSAMLRYATGSPWPLIG